MQGTNTQNPTVSNQQSLREILAEVAERVRRRRESKEIVGYRRKQLIPGSQGGEYLEEEVIALRP